MSQPATSNDDTSSGERRAKKRGISHAVRIANESIVMTVCGHTWSPSEVDLTTGRHRNARDCDACGVALGDDNIRGRCDDGTFRPTTGDGSE